MDLYQVLLILITIFSIVMTIQGLFTLFWMLFAWDDPEDIERNKSPKEFHKPKFSFSAIIPARNEENVISDTLMAVSLIDYPEDLKEVIIVCRSDDKTTIAKVKETLKEIDKTNLKLVTFDDYPINKPHGLNIGLREASGDLVVIFDAEDEPHRDIYKIINTVILRDKVDVVQSGIQLMNYKSPWFATINVLEYFFWFKSALHLFAKFGLIPLGGNSVFFKRSWLTKVGGWKEESLTEDADIGIRLSILGAKTRVIYDEAHATQEETPPDLLSFIRQRARWGQGFLQILLSGKWLGLPRFSQKALCLYFFIWPALQVAMCIYIPVSIFIIIFIKAPVIIALLSVVPFYLLVLQLITLNIGLYEFTRDYGLKYSIFSPLKILLTFYPFQFVLGISFLRALTRMILGNYKWEKTLHVNAHRLSKERNPQFAVEREQAI